MIQPGKDTNFGISSWIALTLYFRMSITVLKLQILTAVQSKTSTMTTSDIGNSKYYNRNSKLIPRNIAIHTILINNNCLPSLSLMLVSYAAHFGLYSNA